MSQDSYAKFASLYSSHYGRIHAYCRRRTDLSDVDDVVSNVFLAVWRRIESAPDGEEALPWLYSVAYRTLANHWRVITRRRRLHRLLENVSAEAPESADHVVVMRTEVREVMEAAAKLKPRDLEILRLALWEELPRDQIATVLGISPDAVKQRLYRAKGNLGRQLKRMQNQPTKSPSPQQGGAW